MTPKALLKDPDFFIKSATTVSTAGGAFCNAAAIIVFPELIEGLWAVRDEAKRARDAPLSQAVKILMNSFYGVLGAHGCRFFDPRLASSITRRGHEILLATRGRVVVAVPWAG